MADIILTCLGCRTNFIWSEGEQQYFEDRGLKEPKHCKPCRYKRRVAQGNPTPPSYPIICHDCGVETTVNFEPLEGRPVYCRKCYHQRKVAS